jgi:type IV secretory pathway protease TraF
MPGQAACFRCGSLLAAKAGAVEVHPPRAPGWRKPFRRIARWMRHVSAARSAEGFAKRAAHRTALTFGRTDSPGLSRSERVSHWADLRSALHEAAVALLLSIVPGLAHALRHQFGTIYLYVISWFVSLVMGVLFYGESLGAASMASAFVLHAWIAMDAVVATKRFKDKMTASAKVGWRLAGIVVLVILLYGTYKEMEHVVGFTVAVADVAVPADQVEPGDSILCRFLPTRAEPPLLKRGDLVLVGVNESGANFDIGPGVYHEYLNDLVGQLIALPGEQVAWTQNGFVVNGRALDPLKFPVPAWLRRQSDSRALGKNQYFVTMEWRMQGEGHGYGGVADVIALTCVYGRRDLLARGVMRWLPMRKRGFLEELE